MGSEMCIRDRDTAVIKAEDSITVNNCEKPKELKSQQNEGEIRKMLRKQMLLEHPSSGTDGIYFCTQYNFSAKRKNTVVTHKLKEHEGFSYCCDICRKTFSTQVSHDVHIKSIHEGVVLPQCKECDKVMQDEHTLKVHKLSLIHI